MFLVVIFGSPIERGMVVDVCKLRLLHIRVYINIMGPSCRAEERCVVALAREGFL